MKTYLQISFYLFLVYANVFAQFEFSVKTDKDKYDYGETIYISSTLKNNSDSVVTIFFSSTGSCHSEFQLDDFQSWLWTYCLPLVEEVNLAPNSSRIYNWTIDPARFGIPESDGIHELSSFVRYRLSPDFSSEAIRQVDTIYFEAPRFSGGQLNVSFAAEYDTLLLPLKDSLNVEVLERSGPFPSVNVIDETWQIFGYRIDSLSYQLQDDYRIRNAELNRMIMYDSITVTSVKQEPQQVTGFYLSNAYPNPFNSTSLFYVEIPGKDKVNIFLYNTLGEKVATIFRGTLSDNIKYTFKIDAQDLSSGVYYYSVQGTHYHKVKKVVLLN